MTLRRTFSERSLRVLCMAAPRLSPLGARIIAVPPPQRPIEPRDRLDLPARSAHRLECPEVASRVRRMVDLDVLGSPGIERAAGCSSLWPPIVAVLALLMTRAAGRVARRARPKDSSRLGARVAVASHPDRRADEAGGDQHSDP